MKIDVDGGGFVLFDEFCDYFSRKEIMELGLKGSEFDVSLLIEPARELFDRIDMDHGG